MSWIGENGKGLALTKMKMSPKFALVSSLVKGFGSGGGGLVVFGDELRQIGRASCRERVYCVV